MITWKIFSFWLFIAFMQIQPHALHCVTHASPQAHPYVLHVCECVKATECRPFYPFFASSILIAACANFYEDLQDLPKKDILTHGMINVIGSMLASLTGILLIQSARLNKSYSFERKHAWGLVFYVSGQYGLRRLINVTQGKAAPRGSLELFGRYAVPVIATCVDSYRQNLLQRN